MNGTSTTRSAPQPTGIDPSTLFPELFTRYAPVLTLTLVRCETVDTAAVLLGIRDAATNWTHQNVVSVPTARTTIGRAEELVATAPSPLDVVRLAWRAVDVVRFPVEWHTFAATGYRARPAEDSIASLLVMKLGIEPSAIENGDFGFSYALANVTYGESLNQDAASLPVLEPLAMVNYLVVPATGVERLLPPRTHSYARLKWASVEGFERTLASRDPAIVFPDETLNEVSIHPVDVCVHGLCLDAAATALRIVDWASLPRL